MGQYFEAINLDLRQHICATDYGSGLKLTEHSWLLSPFVNAVLHALKPGGIWHKRRVVWARDYMLPGLFLDDFKRISKTRTLYSLAVNNLAGFVKIRPSIADGPMLRYLVNHDLGEYVDLTNLPEDSPGWRIHPLPLLTCCGNDNNGGDFYGNNAYVESWAGNTISAAYDLPVKLTEIYPNFLEGN